MSNFELFTCNICNRQIEKIVHPRHATINKCVITHKCAGTLVKISESDSQTMLGASPDATLVNWVARGSALSNKNLVIAEPIAIDSGMDRLTIALESHNIGLQQTVEMTFDVQQQTNNQYVEYLYNRLYTVQAVSGQDDSSKKIALRFINGSSPDQVTVYVNGVVLDAARYDRTVLGRLTFTPALSDDSNQIRVVVHKQVVTASIVVEFARNTFSTFAVDDSTAWSNVNQVSINEKDYIVFTSKSLLSVANNAKLVLTSISASAGYVLLAAEPYTHFDRDILNAVNIQSLISTAQVITMKNNIKNKRKMFLSANNIQSVLPLISVTSKIAENIMSAKVNDVDTTHINAYLT
jgi:hypothetical protein